MNYYKWKATTGNVGDVYAFDEEEAKIKVETLFDVIVSKIELLKENVSREDIKSNNSNHKKLKKGDKLRRIGDGRSFTYFSESDDPNYFYVKEMCVPVKVSDFEKEEHN
ncbi:hypothetical protein [Priestia aryabhattai]|uniref:hypothetical protein n=1 Tax=Priestia aryabhattai TaxID=412384 RepID=UPI00210D6EFE|nr:hypothetical protein [Priestia aryabhattai]